MYSLCVSEAKRKSLRGCLVQIYIAKLIFSTKSFLLLLLEMWYGNGKKTERQMANLVEVESEEKRKKYMPSFYTFCETISLLGGFTYKCPCYTVYLCRIYENSRRKYCPHLLDWIQPKSMDGKLRIMIMICYIRT